MPRPTAPPPARPRRAAALGLALAALLAPSPALAQDPAQDDETPAEGDPLRPATPVQLRVEPAEGGLWKMTLTNRSDATWRVAADARLLAVELLGAPPPDLVARKQKGGAKPRGFPRDKLARCQMPAGMRPAGITPARSLVLKPGERYVELVHPVALCGAAAVLDSLGPGAIVYPSFGTPEKRKKNAPPRPLPPPPYVAQPLREQEGMLPLRWLDATPFVLPSTDDVAATSDAGAGASRATPASAGSAAGAPATGGSAAGSSAAPPKPDATSGARAASASAPDATSSDASAAKKAPGASANASSGNAASTDAPPAAEPDDYGPRLSVQARRRADASDARAALLSATLRNTGKTPVSMRLRPDALVFRVKALGAARAAECGFANARRASVRDFFTTLSPGKARDLSSILGEVCPHGTLERPGVYEVWPRVELHESGERFDLAAVTGSFAAASPTLLRVRSGDLPYHDRPPEALGPEGEAPRAPAPDAAGAPASKGPAPAPTPPQAGPPAAPPRPAPEPRGQAPAGPRPAEPAARRP
ncbi:MAG TPA: hypothetical protein VFS43_31670 [Polyangiaceae bacterium]|nr:hypothetical protein [Polyangiaceae bacterium]